MRIKLPTERQRRLMESILGKMSTKEVAELCGLSERTIRDWRRAKLTMDFNAVKKMCAKTKTKIPKDIKLEDDYWYTEKGSSLGAQAVLRKYGHIGGDPEYRKKKRREWWEKEGKYRKNTIFSAKSIKKQRFSSRLAEFTGIVLGDGGITKSQVSFTFHSKDDKEYSNFVIDLTKNLFDVYVGVHYAKYANVVICSISRKELVRFCTEKLDLKQGNKIKQQVDIPDWIKNNKEYSIACVRGLVDTDGCIFTHRYRVGGKRYEYKKIAFTSHSSPLLCSVYNILVDNNLNPRFAKKVNKGKMADVRIDSIKDMQNYFKIFGSHNPKHLMRYKK